MNPWSPKFPGGRGSRGTEPEQVFQPGKTRKSLKTGIWAAQRSHRIWRSGPGAWGISGGFWGNSHLRTQKNGSRDGRQGGAAPSHRDRRLWLGLIPKNPPGFVDPSSETPRKRSPNLIWKNTAGTENAHKPNTRLQGTGADSETGQFQDLAPKSRLKPHRVESTERGWMRIHGNKTRPPRCRVGANFRRGSAAPDTLRIPKGGAALRRDFRHIPDTAVPNARRRFHVRGAEWDP